MPVDRRQNERSYGFAFPTDIRDSHLLKSGPSWCSFLIGKSRIPFRSFGAQVLFEHRLKRTLPTLAKCRDPERSSQLLGGMSRQIQKRVNLGHADSLRTVNSLHNLVVCTDFSLLQHTKVESRPVMFYEESRHPRFIHANADAIARHAWLRHFKFSTTDTVSIADAHLVIGKSLDGEVFSELTERKVVAAQKALPVMVRIHLVNEYGAVLPSVTREIGLAVTSNIELAHHLPSRDRTLPNRGANSLTVPRHVAWKPDVH